jgi:FkbM family methyltransferase
VSAIEKLTRGVVMVPVFGAMLALLRVRALIFGPLTMQADERSEGAGRYDCRLPDLIQMYLYLFGVWEPDMAAFIRSRLRPGDVFIDVGANVGFDSLLASRCVADDRDEGGKFGGAVVAIEAAPAVFAQLEHILALNGSPSNIRAINKAASDAPGTLRIFAGPQHNIGLTTTVQRGTMRQVAEVEALPLGELLRDDEIARAKLIKVDVEGGEDTVLAGMIELLDRLPNDVEIAVELSPLWWSDRNKTAAEVLRPFTERGFNVYTIANNYWPWRYLWSEDVDRPRRLRDAAALTRPVKRIDVVLSRLDCDAL